MVLGPIAASTLILDNVAAVSKPNGRSPNLTNPWSPHCWGASIELKIGEYVKMGVSCPPTTLVRS